MKVFISWSGDKSKAVAEQLKDWLPQIINLLDPWISFEDIGKGRRWSPEIAGQLAVSKAGIVCVTASNRENPWLLFEAGALSKAVEDAYVCTFLIDLKPEDVTGPLSQFQHTLPVKEDVRRLVGTLNKALAEKGRPETQLEAAFDMWWPKLEESLGKLPVEKAATLPKRSSDDILAEVLEGVRAMSRRAEMDSEGLKRSAEDFLRIARMEFEEMRREEDMRRRDEVLWGNELRNVPISASGIHPSALPQRLEAMASRVAPGFKIRLERIGGAQLEVNLEFEGRGLGFEIPRSASEAEMEKRILEAADVLRENIALDYPGPVDPQ